MCVCVCVCVCVCANKHVYNFDRIHILHITSTASTNWNGKASLDIVQRYAGAGARCSSVVRAFAHGAMGRRIDPSWGGPIELFLVPASAPRLV